MRKVSEWIAKHDDQKVPAYVKLRVFNDHQGICYLTGVKIRPGDEWDLEHIKALCNGGEHRESNLAPALRTAHKEKTAQDRGEKAKVDRLKKKHFGMSEKKRGFQTNKNGMFKKKLDGTVERR